MDSSWIETTRRRAERYWYEDGIWEIGFGLVNLFLAGYFLLAGKIQNQGWWNLALLILQLAVVVGISRLMSRLVVFLKTRITYPRTGYVAYRRGSSKARARRILLTGLLSAGIGVAVTLVAMTSQISSITPLIPGVLMAGVCIFLGYRFGLLRMYGLALLTLLISMGTALSPNSVETGQSLFFAGNGLIFLASGGVVLAHYLRSTQAQAGFIDYEAPGSLEEDADP